VPTGAYGAIFNDSRFRTIDRRTFVDLQYQRTLGAFRADIRTYVDNYHYSGDYPYGVASEPDSLYHDYADGTWMGIDGRASRSLPWKQTLTFGAEYRNNVRQNQGAYYSDPSAPELFTRQSSANFGAYVQDEVALHEKLLATMGLRYDRYAQFSRVTPRGALIFRPSVNRAVKLLLGRAFRAPNAYERDYYTLQGPLGAETIDSQEIVWEEYVSDWLRTSTSVYWNDVEGLITLQGEAMHGQLFFTNQGHVHARGVEFETEIKTKWKLQGLASYGLQRAVDQSTGEGLSNSPRHVFKGRLMFPTGRAGSSIGVELQSLSQRKTIASGAVPRATVVNVTMIEPVTRWVNLTAQVTDLFDQRYADPGSEEHVQDSIEQNGRTLMVGVRWTFGGK
jgi:iron complex outermembrane receptor protein